MVLRFRRLVKAAEWSRRWPGFIGTYTIICKFPCSTDFGSSLQEIKPDTKKYVLNEIRRMVEECLGDEEKLRTTRGGLSLQRLSVPQQLIEDNITHKEFDESFFIWNLISAKFLSSLGKLPKTDPLCDRRDAIIQIDHYMRYLFREKNPHAATPCAPCTGIRY